MRKMWAVVLELFANGERATIRDALEDIASPLDSYDFSSAGVYAF